jgi:hypothetical protein
LGIKTSGKWQVSALSSAETVYLTTAEIADIADIAVDVSNGD